MCAKGEEAGEAGDVGRMRRANREDAKGGRCGGETNYGADNREAMDFPRGLSIHSLNFCSSVLTANLNSILKKLY